MKLKAERKDSFKDLKRVLKIEINKQKSFDKLLIYLIKIGIIAWYFKNFPKKACDIVREIKSRK